MRFAFRPLSLSACLLASLLLLLPPVTAWAHPHVWIDARAVLLLEQNRLTAVQQEWRFDALFSNLLIGDHDRNGDGALDDAEQQTLKEGAFDNLAAYSYFTRIGQNGQQQLATEAQAFSARIEGDVLVYRFVTPLPQPASVRAGPVTIGVYDESYYVDVQMTSERSVALAGSGAAGCRVNLGEGQPIYLGTIYPTTIELHC